MLQFAMNEALLFENDLTTTSKAVTITLSEVLQKLSKFEGNPQLRIFDDGSGKVTNRTEDNEFKEYTVFSFRSIEDLWERLNANN